MQKDTYSDILKNPKWQKMRLEILNRDGFMCLDCGDTENELQVHHKIYTYGKKPWEYHPEEMITLCKNCHQDVTQLKRHIKTMIDLEFLYSEPLFLLQDIVYATMDMTPDKLSKVVEYAKSLNNG
jgi:hypothetical protein